MSLTVAKDRSELDLKPFDERFAGVVAGWVETEEELRWLAPSTEPPLNAPKVIAWKKPNGLRFVLTRGDDPLPLGYAELNPMRRDAGHKWLGHVVVNPGCRGHGLGGVVVRTLLSYAFDRLFAERVSLIVFPDNTVAIQCYLGAGFTVLGEEHHRFNDAGPRHRLLRLQAERPA